MDLIQDQKEHPIPPLDVYVEIAVSFASILLGELISVGSLQSADIFSSKNRKPLVAPAYRTRDFDIYSNRSKAMSNKSS
jgi:hypothetical protein